MSAAYHRRSWVALILSWCLLLNAYACCLHQAGMTAAGADSVTIAYCSLTERSDLSLQVSAGEPAAGQMPMLMADCPLCSSGASVAVLASSWQMPLPPGWQAPIHPSSALPLISQPAHWPPASPRASPYLT